jgi:predicted transcriptional regulator
MIDKYMPDVLMERDEDFAVFGVGREIVNPLIKAGKIHKDTYRYTGGAKITKKGRELYKINSEKLV